MKMMSALDIDVHKVLLTEVCQDWSELVISV